MQAGHTFVIAMQPEAGGELPRFDVYQSFINHYSLHQYLNKHPRALSYTEMVQVSPWGRGEGCRRPGCEDS